MKLKFFEAKENENFKCPVCGTNKNGNIFLVPEYNNFDRTTKKAKLVHWGCYIKVCETKKHFLDLKDFSKFIFEIGKQTTQKEEK